MPATPHELDLVLSCPFPVHPTIAGERSLKPDPSYQVSIWLSMCQSAWRPSVFCIEPARRGSLGLLQPGAQDFDGHPWPGSEPFVPPVLAGRTARSEAETGWPSVPMACYNLSSRRRCTAIGAKPPVPRLAWDAPQGEAEGGLDSMSLYQIPGVVTCLRQWPPWSMIAKTSAAGMAI